MRKHALTSVMLVAMSTPAMAEPARLAATELDRITAGGLLGNLLGRLAGNSALLSIFGRLGLPTGGGPTTPTPIPTPAPQPPAQTLDDIIAGSIIKF